MELVNAQADAGEAVILEVILLEVHPAAALQLQGFKMHDDGSQVPLPEYVEAEV